MADKVATTGYGKDGGHGLVSCPKNNMLNTYYNELNAGSGGYDDRGNPKSTGKQGEKVTGKVEGDPTKGAGKYKADTQKYNKGPNGVISKKISKPHKIKE